MLEDFSSAIDSIIQHLDLDILPEKLDQVVTRYLPRQRAKEGEATHFQHGVANRFRLEFSQEELNYLSRALGTHLEKMGYPA